MSCYDRKWLHTGSINKTSPNWYFSNDPVHWKDAAWKKDQINKVVGQKKKKWRQSNQAYVY